MSDFTYTDKVLDYFRNPRNMGKIEDPDGIGKVGNKACGDVMWIYIKVKDGIITDCKFETFGCVAAIATSSVLTELAKGKNFEQALGITNKDVADELEGLPPIKMHCSLLAEEGLRSAIDDYRKKTSQDEGK
ncbi:MAG: Fe-S cluster assembly scaffold protein NifU [Candidatus Omnitrophica bacterium]|nr:Fe-S cluster assembly scaffold protein NifU [Candidatus Omnitrophota bacterium]